MPVSLCEWRVRIGTFVHWIRDYEITERKERLLKERTRRIKVLCERLREKKGFSEQESGDGSETSNKSKQGDCNSQDPTDPKVRSQCLHGTAIRQSSGKICIKDLLTSCDHCIKDLLTPNDSHVKDILAPSDTSIKELLTPTDSCIEDSLPSDVCQKDSHTASDSYSKDLMPDDCHIHELLNESDSCIKGLLTASDSWEDVPLLSLESYGNERYTPLEPCNNDLLPQHVPDSCDTWSELQAQFGSYVNNPITPKDSDIHELLMPRDPNICNFLKHKDSHISKILTPKDSYIHDLLMSEDSYTIELLKPANFSIKKLFTSDSSGVKVPFCMDATITDLPTSTEYCIKEHQITSDSSISEQVTPSNASKEHTNLPDICTEEQNTLSEVVIKGQPLAESAINSLSMLHDSCHIELLDNDVRMQGNLDQSCRKEQPTSKSPVLAKSDDGTGTLNLPNIPSPTCTPTSLSSFVQHGLPNEKDSSIGTSYFSSGLHFFRRMICNALGEFCLLYMAIIVLMRSGDVETNPGPERSVSEKEFIKLSKLIGPSYYGSLGVHLEISHAELRKIEERMLNYSDAFMTVFTRWRDKQPPGTDIRALLAERLERSGLGNLSSELLAGSLTPNWTGAPVTPPGSQKEPLSPELIKRHAEDFKFRTVHEEEFIKLSKLIEPSYYKEVGVHLEIPNADLGQILAQHMLNFSDAFMTVFTRWRNKQQPGTDIRALLAERLERSGLGNLSSELLAGSLVLHWTGAPVTPPGSETEPLSPELVKRCAEDFKLKYRTTLCKIRANPLDPDSLMQFEDMFTNLFLQEEHQKSKRPLKYEDLFNLKVNGESSRRLLVQGEAGAGKTTFCAKIAWDWLNGSSVLLPYVWTIIVPLREAEQYTIGEIAKSYLTKENPATAHQITEYIRSHQKEVFIAFDGLDEFGGKLVKQGKGGSKSERAQSLSADQMQLPSLPSGSASVQPSISTAEAYGSPSKRGAITNILRSDELAACPVLVTSRPWKVSEIRWDSNLRKLYTFIHVEGFNKENVKVYIRKYFQDDEARADQLIQLIRGNDIISGNMASYPIYIAMLCLMWRELDDQHQERFKSLQALSQIFEEMFAFLKVHYAQKVTDLGRPAFTEYLKQIERLMQPVAKLAFSGLQKRTLVFQEKDVQHCSEAIESACRVGVLSQEKRLITIHDKSRNYLQSAFCFPHRLFQEYMAGVHFASIYESDYNEFNRLMEEVVLPRKKKFRYLLYFAVSRNKAIANHVMKCLLQDDMEMKDIDFLVDVAFESQDQDVATMLRDRVSSAKMEPNVSNLTPHTAAGYVFTGIHVYADQAVSYAAEHTDTLADEKGKISTDLESGNVGVVSTVQVKRDSELCTVEGIFDDLGGELHLDTYGFKLIIPPGALQKGTREKIGLGVLTDLPHDLILGDDEMIVSFGFICLPSGLHFKKPVRLIIPHCAILSDPGKVEVVLYMWSRFTNGIERIPQCPGTCVVKQKHFELMLQHFTKGSPSIRHKHHFTRGKSMHCMLYLPKKMPQSRKPVLEFRLEDDLPREEMQMDEQTSITQAILDRKVDVFVKRRDLEVSCQVEEDVIQTKIIYRDNLFKTKSQTLGFRLNLSDKPDESPVTIELFQITRLAEILFDTRFSVLDRALSIEMEGANSVTQEQLDQIARKFPCEQYTSFCNKLGTEFNEAQAILEEHNKNFYRALMKILMAWKARTGGPYTHLETALRTSGASNLVAHIKPGSPIISSRDDCRGVTSGEGKKGRGRSGKGGRGGRRGGDRVGGGFQGSEEGGRDGFRSGRQRGRDHPPIDYKDRDYHGDYSRLPPSDPHRHPPSYPYPPYSRDTYSGDPYRARSRSPPPGRRPLTPPKYRRHGDSYLLPPRDYSDYPAGNRYADFRSQVRDHAVAAPSEQKDTMKYEREAMVDSGDISVREVYHGAKAREHSRSPSVTVTEGVTGISSVKRHEQYSTLNQHTAQEQTDYSSRPWSGQSHQYAGYSSRADYDQERISSQGSESWQPALSREQHSSSSYLPSSQYGASSADYSQRPYIPSYPPPGAYNAPLPSSPLLEERESSNLFTPGTAGQISYPIQNRTSRHHGSHGYNRSGTSNPIRSTFDEGRRRPYRRRAPSTQSRPPGDISEIPEKKPRL